MNIKNSFVHVLCVCIAFNFFLRFFFLRSRFFVFCSFVFVYCFFCCFVITASFVFN